MDIDDPMMQKVLAQMKAAFQALGKALQSWGQQKAMPPQNTEQQEVVAVAPVATPRSTVPAIDTLEPWTDPLSNRHNVRVLCDLSGLTLEAKNVITACVEVESGFYNYFPNGEPVTHKNYNTKGILTSTDWGVVQINDFYHCGEGKDFPSADFVMANPDKAVQFMIDMYKVGRLSMWVSYSSGAYIKYMPSV